MPTPEVPRKPWLKWFPTDWRADPALRMCGLAARGLWIELLGYMHEAVPYGHLLVNGRAPTEAQLATLVGVDVKSVRAGLSELEKAGVFDRIDNVIVSRRMVRDAEKAVRDRENGKGGGNPRLKPQGGAGVNPPDNPAPNPKDNAPDKAHMPEARGQIPIGSVEGVTPSTPSAEIGNTPPPLPAGLSARTWAAWKAHLACKGKGFTPISEQYALVQLAKHADPDGVVSTALANGHVTLPPIGGWPSQQSRTTQADGRAAVLAYSFPGGASNERPDAIDGTAERIA